METRREIIKTILADGTTANVEATSMGDEEEVAFTIPSFDDVANSIEGIARSLGRAIQRANPKKATVEFGVDFSIESGHLTPFIVKGTESANLKITLEWGEGNT